MYLAVQNWCDVYDKSLASKKTLNKHRESDVHAKRLALERDTKNPPSDPGSDVEDYYNYNHEHDKSNVDNSIPLTLTDITALNEEFENLSCGDEDCSDAGYNTP